MKRLLQLLTMSALLVLGLAANSRAQAPCQFCNESKDCQNTPKGISGQLGCESGWQCGNAACEHSVKLCWFTRGGCIIPKDDECDGCNGGSNDGGGGGGGGGGWCDVYTPSWECDGWEAATNRSSPSLQAIPPSRCASAITRNGFGAIDWTPLTAQFRRSDE